MSRRTTRRGRGEQVPPERTMTIDATAGPPWRPPSAPAIDENYAEQAGGVDASSRDEHNFVDGTAPLYARVLVEHYNAQVAQSRIGEAEDREMADDHVANADARASSSGQCNDSRIVAVCC